MPAFDRVVRVGAYEGPLAGVIRGLKFRGVHHARGWLGRVLAQKIAAAPEMADVEVVQAVPLYWMRRFRRGYNQAAIVAAELARQLHLPLADDLVRVRNTRPQVGLPRSRRAQNVKGAFDAPHAGPVRDRCVLLVDDVTTTGATASEAAKALLQAGTAGSTWPCWPSPTRLRRSPRGTVWPTRCPRRRADNRTGGWTAALEPCRFCRFPLLPAKQDE